MVATGTVGPDSNVIECEGEHGDMVTGDKNAWFRAQWNFIDNNTHTYEGYAKDSGGKEYRSMEIVYTRK